MNALPIRPIAETPDSVTLSRVDFEAIAELVAEIMAITSTWLPESPSKKQALEALGRAGGDAGKLSQLLNWARARAESIPVTTTVSP